MELSMIIKMSLLSQLHTSRGGAVYSRAVSRRTIYTYLNNVDDCPFYSTGRWNNNVSFATEDSMYGCTLPLGGRQNKTKSALRK